MLLSPLITSLDDQGLADCMREICARAGVGPAVTSIAVSQALEAYQDGASRSDALRAGTQFIVRVRKSGARSHRARRVSAAVQRVGGLPAPLKRPEWFALILGLVILAVSLSGVL